MTEGEGKKIEMMTERKNGTVLPGIAVALLCNGLYA